MRTIRPRPFALTVPQMTHAVKQKLERFRRDPSVETEIGALKQLTEAEALWLSPVLSD
jgi:hypothetical protein